MYGLIFLPSFLLFASLQLLCNALPSWDLSIQRPLNLHEATTSIKGTRQALKDAGIIPDVLNDFEPSVSILLSYPWKHKSVTLGNKIKPKAVTSQPIFDIFASETTPTRTIKDNATYTLVLTDPDATSRADPVKAQMCHWIATNITKQYNSDVSGGFEHLLSLTFDKSSGGSGIHELMPYVPPSPPPKTGYHRYVFVLLAPAGDAHLSKDLKTPKDRPHWGYGKVGAGVREWAEENDLVAVGANFFYSQNKKQ